MILSWKSRTRRLTQKGALYISFLREGQPEYVPLNGCKARLKPRNPLQQATIGKTDALAIADHNVVQHTNIDQA